MAAPVLFVDYNSRRILYLVSTIVAISLNNRVLAERYGVLLYFYRESVKVFEMHFSIVKAAGIEAPCYWPSTAAPSTGSAARKRHGAESWHATGLTSKLKAARPLSPGARRCGGEKADMMMEMLLTGRNVLASSCYLASSLKRRYNDMTRRMMRLALTNNMSYPKI